MIRIPKDRISKLPSAYAADVLATPHTDAGDHLIFADKDIERVVLRHAPERLAGKAIALATEEVRGIISGRIAACTPCAWNHDWICEHPGCLPCAQRKLPGRLKSMLERVEYQCPAGRF